MEKSPYFSAHCSAMQTADPGTTWMGANKQPDIYLLVATA